MKRSLGISNFLEEISSLSHSIVFFYSFALIAEQGFLISLLFFGTLHSNIFPFLLCLALKVDKSGILINLSIEHWNTIAPLSLQQFSEIGKSLILSHFCRWRHQRRERRQVPSQRLFSESGTTWGMSDRNCILFYFHTCMLSSDAYIPSDSICL